MVVLKVLRNESKVFKALSLGVGNANAYDVKIDNNVVATLRPGEETEIELPTGSHTVVFKVASFMGIKSNKLTVNIDANKDYIVQVQNGMGGIVASYTLTTFADKVVKCPNCGAPNKVSSAKSSICEYCGSPL